MTESVVYTVLLNWNGWRDTIACLESLLASTGVKLKVIVCDNDSSDDSLTHIASWAAGNLLATQPEHPRLGRLLGNLSHPLATSCIDRARAESGMIPATNRLTLIANGGNPGFAAGNNIGIRYAMAQPDMSHVWVLNNDTLVEPDALANMLKRIALKPQASVCGSMIHFFDQPERIQALGGNRFNDRTGCAACSEGRFLHEQQAPESESIEQSLSYISGCSLLLPRHFLETVGLMCEEYFLYYEEIDWFTRAAGRFELCLAEDAVIYHREGSAIGSAGWQRAASPLAEFHNARSRLIFMRKFRPVWLPWCYAHMCLQMLRRMSQGQLTNARVIASALLGKNSHTTCQ